MRMLESLGPKWHQLGAALPPGAWVLVVGAAINRFGSFVNLLLVVYLADRGYEASAAASGAAAMGLGSLLASLVGAQFADRVGHPQTIAISMFGSAVTVLMLSQTGALPQILTLAFVGGLVGEAYRPAAFALLSELVPHERRITAFAIYRVAINVGFTAGAALAGVIVTVSYLLAFLGDAVTSCMFGLIAVLVLRRIRSSSRSDSNKGVELVPPSRNPAFVRFLAASALVGFVYFQAQSTFALQVRADGFSAQTYAWLMAFSGAVNVVCELPIASISTRVGMRGALAAGMICVGIGFGVNALSAAVPVLLAGVLLWTLGESAYWPAAGSYVAGVAPTSLRGRYLGLWGFAWSSGLFVGPFLGGLVFAWSQAFLWSACFVVASLAAGLSWKSIPRQHVVGRD